MILRDGKVLLGTRKGSHGAGELAFPGGHLDYMESFESCARRETLEECASEIENVRFQFVANLQRYAPKHYAHIGLIADWKSGEPKVLEPQKCDGWGWYDSTPSQRGRSGQHGSASTLTKRAGTITTWMRPTRPWPNAV
jgi:8-oxo-dGTP diphosphatase